jgi:ribonuclease HI
MPEIEEPDMERKWVIYVDGSSTKKQGGAGIVLFTPDGEELSSSLKLEFKATNNEAEYEAVVAGLGLALELGADSVELRSDSQVIVGHVNGEFEAKGEKMKKYLAKVQSMQTAFQKFCIKKIPREDNEKADHLARMASTEAEESDENDRVIPTLRHPSIFEEASNALQIFADRGGLGLEAGNLQLLTGWNPTFREEVCDAAENEGRKVHDLKWIALQEGIYIAPSKVYFH